MQNCFLYVFTVFFQNQVPNVLTEVVPFCKLGHKYITIDIVRYGLVLMKVKGQDHCV